MELRVEDFSVGQRVRKVSGYGFEGPISGVNHKRDGTINYTVELEIGCIADGMQHIFSPGQLEAAKVEQALNVASVQRLDAGTVEVCLAWLIRRRWLGAWHADELRAALLPQPVGGD